MTPNSTRGTISRRTLAKAVGAAVGTLALTHPLGTLAQDKVTIHWWDQFLPIAPLEKKLFAQFHDKNPNVTVEYKVYNPNEMGQALQLAHKSNQAPDVSTLAGIGLPARKLYEEGWFQKLTNGVQIDKSLPAGSLLEGFTNFDGDIYSFPTFSFRQYTTLNWFNKDLMKLTDSDPETGPKTWEEMRAAAKAITDKGNGRLFGWIFDLNFTDRIAVHLDELAQTAGAPGGIDPKSGEYAYATDPYAQAMEFLLSMQKDGSLFPASSTLDARAARTRWATGTSGMFFDGPWNIGVVQSDLKEFIDKVGVAPVPRPQGTSNLIHVGPQGGTFWLSAQSKHPEIASDILTLFTTSDYYVGLAEQMDQPPLDLDAVDKANVHPTYKQAVGFYKNEVRLGPSAVVRNPAVSLVNAEMKDIHPNLGEITQGVFSGDVKDYQAALKTYNDAMTAERDRALKVVQSKGQRVSQGDWVFANWDPAKDYTTEMYPKGQ